MLKVKKVIYNVVLMCVLWKKKLGNIIGLLIIEWIGFYYDFKKGLSILEYDFFLLIVWMGWV